MPMSKLRLSLRTGFANENTTPKVLSARIKTTINHASSKCGGRGDARNNECPTHNFRQLLHTHLAPQTLIGVALSLGKLVFQLPLVALR